MPSPWKLGDEVVQPVLEPTTSNHAGSLPANGLAAAAARKGVSSERLLTALYTYPRQSPSILTCPVNIRLDEDMKGRLLEEAFRQKVHHADLIRTFIEWGLEQCI